MTERVLIPEDLFVELMVGDIRSKIQLYTRNVDGIARMFCRMLNKIRSGNECVVEISQEAFSELNLKGCMVSQPNGRTYHLKSNKEHANLYGKTLTIWVDGYTRYELKPRNIRWVLVAHPDKDRPQGFEKALKTKFPQIGTRNVNELIRIYDTYLEEYKKALAA